jgi:RNA polymerase-binding transcription factor DksA
VNDRPEQTDDVSPATPTADQPEDSVPGHGRADLDRIERDLAGVETALQRLDAGTYWTDEISGESIPDDVLVNDPVARRIP